MFRWTIIWPLGFYLLYPGAFFYAQIFFRKFFRKNPPRKTKAEFRFTTAALITIEEVVEPAAVATEQRTAVLRHLERYRATG